MKQKVTPSIIFNYNVFILIFIVVSFYFSLIALPQYKDYLGKKRCTSYKQYIYNVKDVFITEKKNVRALMKE